MDGEVIIGITGDTKELEKKLNNLKKELSNYEKEAAKLAQQKLQIETEVKINREDLEKEAAKVNKELLSQRKYYAEMHWEFPEAQMQKFADKAADLKKKYEEAGQPLNEINKKIQQNVRNQELANSKIKEYKEKWAQVNGIKNIKGSIDGIGDSMKNIVKTAGRWVLAIFSIRSAYSAVRNAISTLSQYDDQMAVNIEWIRYLLASTLKPIIETIINLAYKLLVYIGYIAKAWFGVNIFANASVKAFKKVNSGIQKTNKSAKELQKTLAGFDEMNILQKDGSTALGGGGGGITMPDFEPMGNIPIPEWVKWIAEHGQLIADILIAIGVALGAIKIAQFLSSLAGSGGAFSTFNTGIAVALAGVTLLAGELINLATNFDKMTESEKISAVALGTLGGAITGTGIGMAAGGGKGAVIGGIIGAITGLIASIAEYIKKNDEQIESIKNVREQEEKLKEVREKVTDVNLKVAKAIDKREEASKKLKKMMQELGISDEELAKIVQTGDESYEKLNGTQKEVYKAYLELQGAIGNVTDVQKEKKKADQEELAQQIAVQIANDTTGESYNKLKKQIVDAWKEGKLTTKQATDLISRMMTNMSTKAQKTFYSDLPDGIRYSLDPDKYKSAFTKFKDWLLNSFRKLKPEFEIQGYYSSYVQGGKKVFAKGGVVYSRLPKLASGGIINQPGRGVPIASAIGGERAAEGVIPLTDSQQMALLGEAIGKYININATVPVYVGNKQIAREIKKINAESDFAFNR